MADVDKRVLDLLCTAMELSEKGKNLYAKALDTCESSLSKEIFTILKNEETEHEIKIRKAYEAFKAGKPADESWSYCQLDERRIRPMFDQLAEKYGVTQACLDEMQALQMGIDLEDGCVRFYEKELSKAVTPEEKAFCGSMLEEEREHRRILSDMQFFFKDPEAWFMEKEHPHLDGA